MQMLKLEAIGERKKGRREVSADERRANEQQAQRL